MSLADELVIFWSSSEGQDEVHGLYLYGLFFDTTVCYDSEVVKEAWLPTLVDCQECVLASDLGKTWLVSVRFFGTPNEEYWLENLDQSLSALLHFGAAVAWAGGEDCSWSPVVLDPNSGIGNVLAAKCDSTGFLCNWSTDKPIEFLNDAQLAALWRFVKIKLDTA